MELMVNQQKGQESIKRTNQSLATGCNGTRKGIEHDSPFGFPLE